MLQLTRLRTNVSPACYPAPSPNPVAPYLIQNVRGNCVTHFAAGATLYCEHDAADQIYQVITGVVRTVTITRDGKRALRGFHVPGEIFGIECAERIAHPPKPYATRVYCAAMAQSPSVL